MGKHKALKIEGGPDNKETPMIEWYWNQVGGTLCTEFPIAERRNLDAVILPDGKCKQVNSGELERYLTDVSFDKRKVIVVQAKANRLGMPLMGQTLFSAMLIKRCYNPSLVRPVALCKEDNSTLRPLLEFAASKVDMGMEVEKVPPSFQEKKWNRSPGTSMISWYWNQAKDKGKLFENFHAVDKTDTDNPQIIRALILSDEPKEWIRWKDIPTSDHKAIYKSLRNRDVTIVHAEPKFKHIGMSLMGETLFSAMLIKRFYKSRPIRSVALCKKNDPHLSQLLKDAGKKVGINVEVEAVPQ